jgi:hypothetical protein
MSIGKRQRRSESRRDFECPQSPGITLFTLLLAASSNSGTVAFVYPSQSLIRQQSWTRLTPRPISSDSNDKDLVELESPPPFFVSLASDVPIEDGQVIEFRQGDLIRDAIRRLAAWSLAEYQWRSAMYKRQRADRQLSESLARLSGDDLPPYLRPMDAESMGPLGKLEQSTVDWLSQVVEEEARRAQQIVKSNGQLIRPMDMCAADSKRNQKATIALNEDMGPLAMLERKGVEWWKRFRSSEYERSKQGALVRPKDLEPTIRGPLGDWELLLVAALRDIEESEKVRFRRQQQSRDAIVRPIDIPGPLGEIELAVSDLLQAEMARAKERSSSPGKFMIRPKDAKVPGPLGQLEQKAYVVLDELRAEENTRLVSVQRLLQENRPMEQAKVISDESYYGGFEQKKPFRFSFPDLSIIILGIIEAIVVGIIRAPQLIFRVLERIQELSDAVPMSDEDLRLLQVRRQQPGNSSDEQDFGGRVGQMDTDESDENDQFDDDYREYFP